MSRREIALATAAVAACTLLVTWPQPIHPSTRVASHDDPLFSMWRLAWIAHALSNGSADLFDGNIFYPARQTLAFSDATLLQGVLAAPFLWMGASPIPVYNVLLMVGFAGSGLAMFVLARHLTGAALPAVVAAAAFTLTTYRVEHFMHLELQWTMWVPLALWALHRAIETGRVRFGLLAGLFVWMQILSCVYYGVFLAIASTAFAGMLILAWGRSAVRALPGLALGALTAVVLTVPYARPYLRLSDTVGMRRAPDLAIYSAAPADYLASSPHSLLWAWTAALGGGTERHLSFGLVAVALAGAALWYRPRRIVAVYAGLAALTIELSFGVNGFLYPALLARVESLGGLRAPARFAILAAAAVAVLAAFGAQVVLQRVSVRGPFARWTLAAALLLLLALDHAHTGTILMEVPYQTATTNNVYKAIRNLGAGPVMELPMPKLYELPGREAFYQFWSIGQWHPLVNGYSGFHPDEYVQTLVRTEHFPDDQSFAQIRHVGIRYIVVHRTFYQQADLASLLARMSARPELKYYGAFPTPGGSAELFLVETR